MREFYFRHDNDPLFVSDVFETSDDLEALVYQIRLVLNTNKGDVLGSEKFGSNLDDMLFSFDFNQDTFNNSLVEQVNTYCEIANNYKLNFTMQRIKDTKYRDVGVIDVAVEGKSILGFIY